MFQKVIGKQRVGLTYLPLRQFAVVYDSKADAYQVLGVSHTEEAKKIKLAYYKLAQKYHPDKQTDTKDPKAAEDKFKSITNAYEMIKDEENRKKYDAARSEAKNPQKAKQSSQSTWQSKQGPNTGQYDPFANSRSQSQKKNTNYYGDFKSRDDFYKNYTGFGAQDAKNFWQKTGGYQNKNKYTSGGNFYKTKSQNTSQDQKTNMYGDTKAEEEWRGGYTQEEEDFYKKHMDGDMFGFKDGKYSKKGWKGKSASNPNDKEYFDPHSIFNKFKFSRKIKKEKKVYEKYTPGEDSNFHSNNRGFNARPDYFQNGWKSAFYTRILNPFKIKNYQNFDKGPQNEFESKFQSAKVWFDSQTHESMHRDTMQNKDFAKILPIRTVAFILTFLFGTNKAVCSLVK